jgi:DNA-binding transcriptional ArsR family regulator
MLNMKLLKSRAQKLTNREERLVSAMQLLGDPTRFKIFKLLLSGKEMCVSEIAGELDVSVSAISQHFRIFELVGLVNKKRYGQKICYVLKGDDLLAKALIRIV